MAGNSFGELFRITTFGESHGVGVGVTIDGCPPGIAVSEGDIQPDLDRRRPGQSAITTPRSEGDRVRILSGVFEGMTTGTPLTLLVENQDARSSDYDELKEYYRPSHADFTYDAKYGIRDWRGSGRASARETLARVAAGAVARKILKERLGVEAIACVQQVAELECDIDVAGLNLEGVEANVMRCPDPGMAQQMIELVEQARDDGDSLGGVVLCVVRGVPAGLGEPVFDKLHADLGKGMMSINAVKGFEIGSGFYGSSQRGSVHNDEFHKDDSGRIRSSTNNAGGCLGGISTGEDIVFRVAFKPTSTIGKAQQTVKRDGEEATLIAKGRHDPCVVPRAVPIVEAMALLVVLDHYLRDRAHSSPARTNPSTESSEEA